MKMEDGCVSRVSFTALLLLNILPQWERKKKKKNQKNKQGKKNKKQEKIPEVASKFTHKVRSMFKCFAEITSAIRALARTVSFFMYEF